MKIFHFENFSKKSRRLINCNPDVFNLFKDYRTSSTEIEVFNKHKHTF